MLSALQLLLNLLGVADVTAMTPGMHVVEILASRNPEVLL